MLLRSSSTPILNSSCFHSRDSSPEPEFQFLIHRTNSISFRSASKRLINGSHVKPPPHHKQHCRNVSVDKLDEKKEDQATKQPSSKIERLFSNSGLDEKEGFTLQTLVSGGGRIGGGGGGRRSDGEDGSEFYSSRSTDAYYEKMISQDPSNSLLLGNYANFLKQVRKDYGKAEEYYERAILANPNDGNIISMYADLIWEKDRDSQRAENYFDQAVKTSPHDSYVLASYAKFLWDAEEEEVKNEAESVPMFFNGPPPLATAS